MVLRLIGSTNMFDLIGQDKVTSWDTDHVIYRLMRSLDGVLVISQLLIQVPGEAKQ